MHKSEAATVSFHQYCGRPDNPVFRLASQMTRQELLVVEKWQNWATFQMLLAYQSSGVFASTRTGLKEDTVRFLYALHDGMSYFAGRQSVLRPMPPIPAVWPDTFPFDLAWSFVEILQKRIDQYQALAAAEEKERSQRVSGMNADCPPLTE